MSDKKKKKDKEKMEEKKKKPDKTDEKKKEKHECNDSQDKRRKKRDVRTVTTGPILRNAKTKEVVVLVKNLDKIPREVTISVVDLNECEFPKRTFLNGKIMTEDSALLELNENGVLNLPDPSVETVIIPPSQTLITRATPLVPPSTNLAEGFEVRIAGLTEDIVINTWGVDETGVIQNGNTMLLSSPDVRAHFIDMFAAQGLADILRDLGFT